MEEMVWIKRSSEWIKDNPGKGTMYKVLKSDFAMELKSLSSTEEEFNFRVCTAGLNPIRKTNIKDSAGIYLILCEASKRVYVGQSGNVDSRVRHHKMCITGGFSTSNRVYDSIKRDVSKFGLDSIQFIKYKTIHLPTTETLLSEECDTMLEFLESGYSLYNSSVPWSTNFIYCHDDYKPVIVELIKRVKSDGSFLGKLSDLLN